MKEICIDCGGETGRAGKHDDSLYVYHCTTLVEAGPFCEGCYAARLANGWLEDYTTPQH